MKSPIRFFRNPEVRKTALGMAVLSACAAAVAFLWDTLFGVFVTLVCILLLLVFAVSTYRRYARIADFSAEIDSILHGGEVLTLGQYAEGELGILQSEIYKMTVRLREQQQHLEADKGFLADTLADISHQLRTPLTSIHLLVSLLGDPELTEDRRQELVRELYGLLSRTDWLITSLLKLSRLDAGAVTFEKEELPLGELLNRAAAPMLVPMELRGQELSVSAEGTFHGDIAWTCEALTNILKNCMEHTPGGGHITVTAEENPLYVQIVMEDNGTGIDKADLPHVFERFYKGKNSGEGSFGIGLALSRTIITAQNGTVKAENLPLGEPGARFTVRFYKSAV